MFNKLSGRELETGSIEAFLDPAVTTPAVLVLSGELGPWFEGPTQSTSIADVECVHALWCVS